mmetsp:Transcript_17026/g.27653  ORF Transcript_17026/g.27653 Transcript_17026/m.27653 type:complete len:120 (+) Transcript_17026:461-820(+)|eukprot:CAMPEP_0178776342 /NCGR_PEP_ID=MMETSP0744-20121128/24669_1 /TAXON_ID=913974 /ORGANISM="Nitzschia punctata, Strain CCMP561" /LENGTH=119 /DNA_ID=CAMNT_0020433369 /DNA_START=382 /DNA_END=741 /DNA_ORIENTATION=+
MANNFVAEQCLRANVGEPVGDGFYFLDTGFIVITEEDMKATFYELQEWYYGSAQPRLQVDLKADIQIQCRVIQSRHGQYTMGRIRIVGVFDRGVTEMLTIRMSLEEYRRMKTLLVNLGL